MKGRLAAKAFCRAITSTGFKTGKNKDWGSDTWQWSVGLGWGLWLRGWNRDKTGFISPVGRRGLCLHLRVDYIPKSTSVSWGRNWAGWNLVDKGFIRNPKAEFPTPCHFCLRSKDGICDASYSRFKREDHWLTQKDGYLPSQPNGWTGRSTRLRLLLIASCVL